MAVRLNPRAAAAFESFSTAADAEWRARTANLELLLRVLGVVQEFIRAKSLIIYGGKSIDFALRAAGGTPIYEDDVLPDYDFYSPDHANHAYELADILHKEFPAIVFKVKRALHVQTVRIWINIHSQPIADLSYLPPALFEKVPTLTRDGVRFVHPFWQYMDMHLSLSAPFAGFPYENVFCRWEKDLKRFALLRELYPPPLKTLCPQTAPVTLHTATLGQHWALAGFAALAALQGTLKRVAGGFVYSTPKFHRGLAWTAPCADAIADELTPATVLGVIPAEIAQFARTMDFGWPSLEIRYKDAVARVEVVTGSKVPVFKIGDVRVASPHVLMKQLAFWAISRARPEYWAYYEWLARNVHSQGCGAAPRCSQPACGSACAPKPCAEVPREYWSIASSISITGVLGGTLSDDAALLADMRIRRDRDHEDFPELTQLPQGYTAGKGARPSFTPVGYWFDLDGRQLKKSK
jgi:hypothetical protein